MTRDKKRFALLAIAMMLALASTTSLKEAQAGRGPLYRGGQTHVDRRAERAAALRPWHAPYYHVQYGRPLALVVPPTAGMQTHWGWGVGGTRLTPIHHQFSRQYPGVRGGGHLRATPKWPSDTTQFGVYYIRAPW